MKTLIISISTLLAFLLLLNSSVVAQNDSTFNKLELNFNFFTNPTTNYSNPIGATYSSEELLLIVYPFQHNTAQFGIAVGYENIKTSMIDTFRIHERRIPLLVTYKVFFGKSQVIYLKAQFGTALTMKSDLELEDETEIKNHRDDIGAPVIANGGIGINIAIGSIASAGLEFGYGYKQFGYKAVDSYNNGAIYFGAFVTLP